MKKSPPKKAAKGMTPSKARRATPATTNVPSNVGPKKKK